MRAIARRGTRTRCEGVTRSESVVVLDQPAGMLSTPAIFLPARTCPAREFFVVFLVFLRLRCRDDVDRVPRITRAQPAGGVGVADRRQRHRVLPDHQRAGRDVETERGVVAPVVADRELARRRLGRRGRGGRAPGVDRDHGSGVGCGGDARAQRVVADMARRQVEADHGVVVDVPPVVGREAGGRGRRADHVVRHLSWRHAHVRRVHGVDLGAGDGRPRSDLRRS